MHFRDSGDFRVLVVDDERLIADSLALILHRNGFAARPAYNGEQALKLAEEWRPAVLISDVVMPGMDGFDTARAVLAFAPDCRVILFSGHGIVDILGRARESCFEVLAKPVHPEVLLSRLANLRDNAA